MRGYLVSWVSVAEGKPLRAMSLQHSQHQRQGCLHPKRKQSGHGSKHLVLSFY